MILDLVREFLEWSGMEFTLKVFDPEVGNAVELRSRQEIARQMVGREDWGEDAGMHGEGAGMGRRECHNERV